MTQPTFDFISQEEEMVKEEKTCWRDLVLLKRHRVWGWDCPAEDIDFLEYDNRKAVALIEYKRQIGDLENCYIPKGKEENVANLEALIDLANKASLPAFITFYHQSGKTWWFHILPLNDIATKADPPPGIVNEYKYVEFLYWLRHKAIPESTKQRLAGGGF